MPFKAGITGTLKTLINFVTKLHIFFAFYTTVLYMNITMQWPLYIATNVALRFNVQETYNVHILK
jgi:hypothetical protein